MKRFIPSITALAAGLATITAFIVLSSEHPAAPLAAFFTGPVSSWWYFGNMLNTTGLLVIAASGSAFALRAGAFNLGGEAQIYAPALVTAVILAAPPRVPLSGPAIVPSTVAIALAAAVGTGALLAFIPGILKARFRISELLTSFLLSAAVTPVVDYLVAGPLRGHTGNLLATTPIAPEFRLEPFMKPSFFNPSFFAAIAVALACGFFLSRTGPGYRFRISGDAPEFARFSGFPVRAATVAGMTVSGALHGLSGFFAITGTWYMCHQGFSAGTGWSALAVALIARRNPYAVIPAALLYAWLGAASEAAVLSTRFSFDSTALVQAVIFLVISAQTPGIPILSAWLDRRRENRRETGGESRRRA